MILSSLESSETVTIGLKDTLFPVINMFSTAFNTQLNFFGFTFSFGDILAFSLVASLIVYFLRRLIDIV